MRVYLIGINGSGMRPLALAALARGFFVCGSDEKISSADQQFYSDTGIAISSSSKQKREWLANANVAVYSSAISANHPEIILAKKLCQQEGRLQLLHRMEFLNDCLADLLAADQPSSDLLAADQPSSKDLRQVAIAGTHGKSSTTAMIVWLLDWLAHHGEQPLLFPVGIFGAKLKAHKNQGFFLGRQVASRSRFRFRFRLWWGDAASPKKPIDRIMKRLMKLTMKSPIDSGAACRIGVYETDESDGSFLLSSAQLRVIVNIDQDHQDYYRTVADYMRSFERFASQAQILVLNLNDAGVRTLFLRLCSERSQLPTVKPRIIGQFLYQDFSPATDDKHGADNPPVTKDNQEQVASQEMISWINKKKQQLPAWAEIRMVSWSQQDGEHYLSRQDNAIDKTTQTTQTTQTTETTETKKTSQTTKESMRILNPTILNFAMIQNALLAMTAVEVLVEHYRIPQQNETKDLASIAPATTAANTMTKPATAALNSFPGLERRMDYLGVYHGWDCYDDYAHHPTAIRCVIDGVRKNVHLLSHSVAVAVAASATTAAAAGPRKGSEKPLPLVVIFQPHRFTRTQQYVKEFAHALLGADVVFLLPITAASETNVSGIGSIAILETMMMLQNKAKQRPEKQLEKRPEKQIEKRPEKQIEEHTEVHCAETVSECLSQLPSKRTGILLTLGAGNISTQMRHQNLRKFLLQ